MAVRITLTNVGANISSTLDIYTNASGTFQPFLTGLSKATLIAGYTFTPPVGATQFQVIDSNAPCYSGIIGEQGPGSSNIMVCTGSTTTTTTSLAPTTTTTTSLPPTTTTTTSLVPTTTTTTSLTPTTTTTTTNNTPTTTTTTTNNTPTTTTTTTIDGTTTTTSTTEGTTTTTSTTEGTTTTTSTTEGTTTTTSTTEGTTTTTSTTPAPGTCYNIKVPTDAINNGSDNLYITRTPVGGSPTDYDVTTLPDTGEWDSSGLTINLCCVGPITFKYGPSGPSFDPNTEGIIVIEGGSCSVDGDCSSPITTTTLPPSTTTTTTIPVGTCYNIKVPTDAINDGSNNLYLTRTPYGGSPTDYDVLTLPDTGEWNSGLTFNLCSSTPVTFKYGSSGTYFDPNTEGIIIIEGGICYDDNECLSPTTTTTTLPPTTTTTTTLNDCALSGLTLVYVGYHETDSSSACIGTETTVYLSGGTTIDTSIGVYITSGSECILAPAGYYSDNVVYRQWNGIGWLGSSTNCGT